MQSREQNLRGLDGNWSGEAASPDLAAAFAGGKQKGARQAEVENAWAAFARERYAQAKAKAEEALKLAR